MLYNINKYMLHQCFSSDSLTIISKLKSVVEDVSILRSYIDDAQSMARAFASCRFTFIPRSGNEVAHYLARLGQKSTVEEF
ncbi:hypothetical protein V6N13_090712 [Hibiscus sabdariffa]